MITSMSVVMYVHQLCVYVLYVDDSTLYTHIHMCNNTHMCTYIYNKANIVSHTHIPYSGKFLRKINLAVFEDFATASKINSSKSYYSIESYDSLVDSRNLIHKMYHGKITSKIFFLKNYPLYSMYTSTDHMHTHACMHIHTHTHTHMHASMHTHRHTIIISPRS